MKHYEVIILQPNGVAVRKGVVAADIVLAIEKAVASVPGSTAANVDRAVLMGAVDIQ